MKAPAAILTALLALASQPALAGDAPAPQPAIPAEVAPFAPRFDYAFSIEIELEPPRYVGPSPAGTDRAAVMIRNGTITGPMLAGKVVPGSGGDWARKQADGTLDFDARYMLELADGTLVYLQNTGFRWASAAAMARLARHEPVPFGEYYMRVTPRFEVRSGRYDWLTRYVFVGVAEKTPKGNRIHYFIVR